MGRNLASKARVQGLSKSKLLLFGAIILGIVFALLYFSGGDDKEGSSNVSDNSGNGSTEVRSKKQVSDDVNVVLARIENNREEKAKALAQERASRESSLVEKMQQTIVPPIVSNGRDNDFKKVEEEALGKEEGVKIQHKYGSIHARTLLFSAKPSAKSDASGVASNMDNMDRVINGLPKKASSDHKGTDNGDQGDGSGSYNKVAYNPDDANMQQEKHTFLTQSNQDMSDYVDSKLNPVISPYELKAGSIIPATMINGLNSDLPGEVIAFVRQNVYDTVTRRYLLIPQGSRLIGVYDSNVSYGQTRALVAWNRLIYPDGSSIRLHAMPGSDLEGYSGFHDIVDEKYAKIFGTSFVVGIITAALQYSQNNINTNAQNGGNGIVYNYGNPTIGQTVAGSLGQQMGQTSLAVVNKNLAIQPTIIIRPNYSFSILTTADMILKPYHLSHQNGGH